MTNGGRGGYQPTAPRLEISAGFRFANIFLNNIFTDLTVGRQIREAQDNVGRSVQQVRACGTGSGTRSTQPPGGWTRSTRSGGNC